ncbi:MAG: apolipoprotein N-acyltransferase [Pseudomonadota bacterium]|nr:apolipoprotein N-acyltransferase [Pseudomonadota bacterium]
MNSTYAEGRGVAGRLTSSRGWRRWLISYLIGALAAAAQPPVHILPVLFISFTGLVWLLDGAQTRRAAFGIGWLFGAGYFAAGLYWVPNALMVDAARFAWLIPFSVLGLSLGMGLFTGLMAIIARLFWKQGISRICMLCGAWVLFEGLRGIIFTGFPWNPIGNVWVAVPPVLQGAAWVGVYGLSLMTVFAAAAPAVMSAPASRYCHSLAMSGLVVVALVAVVGAVRLENPPPNRVDAPVIRLVQPNIAQKEKWSPTKRAINFARKLQLSTLPAAAQPTHIVWPETAVSFKFLFDPAAQLLLRRIVPQNGYLLTGALRVDRVAGRAVGAHNSLVAIDGDGRPQTVYDKHHLVPFGEYVPFRSVLPVEKITPGAIDFSAGTGLRSLRLPGLPPFSPLICYEAIFPGRVVVRRDRPEWLLNVTNDAWFGISAGPYQHFASAQMRAVEEGLPLVRVANTGVSGIIDSYGRVIASIELGRHGVLDVALPAPAVPTPFAQLGNVIPAALMIVLCFISVLTHKKEPL